MAASPRTVSPVRTQFHRILDKLELMALDSERLKRRPDDCAFVDDMLLQLKLWADDIREADESLEWADELHMVSVPLRVRLKSLEEHVKWFDDLTKTAQDGQGKSSLAASAMPFSRPTH
jgi:hypothetical protein